MSVEVAADFQPAVVGDRRRECGRPADDGLEACRYLPETKSDFSLGNGLQFELCWDISDG